MNWREEATLHCDECNLTWNSAGGDLMVDCKEYQRAGTNGQCKARVTRFVGEEPKPVIPWGIDGLREPLARFAAQMELKLRKNDHKNALGWHKQPIEALVRLMLLEFEEFKVSDEFYPVERAREELVDIANFALILYDRLGILKQDQTRHEQDKK